MSQETEKAVSGMSSAEHNVIKIALSSLRPFPNHAFKSKSEEEIDRMRDSIKEMGIIQPIIVRPTESTYKYEIICGHSRVEAAKHAGFTEIAAIIREMTDDEAIVLAIETNIAQRSFKNWRHSEKAKSIFQYHEIIKNPGKRTDLAYQPTSGGNRQRSENARSRHKTALVYGVSEFTIKQYLALHKLVDGLMERLDAGMFRTSAAEEFSFMNESAQKLLDEVLGEHEPDERNVITLAVAKNLRKMLANRPTENLSDPDRESIKDEIRKILTADNADKDLSGLKEKEADVTAIKLPTDQYNQFFSDIPKDEIVETTITALALYLNISSNKESVN